MPAANTLWTTFPTKASFWPQARRELERLVNWARAPEALEYVRHTLPAKLKETSKKLGIDGKRVVRTLWLIVNSPLVPGRAKLWALGGLLYWLDPFDIIPDFIAGVGYADDIVVLGASLAAATRYIAKAAKREKAPVKGVRKVKRAVSNGAAAS